MTARERYYFNHHTRRLILWQIENAERERKARLREFKKAWKGCALRIALRRVIADNVQVYNRAIAEGM